MLRGNFDRRTAMRAIQLVRAVARRGPPAVVWQGLLRRPPGKRVRWIVTRGGRRLREQCLDEFRHAADELRPPEAVHDLAQRDGLDPQDTRRRLQPDLLRP